MSMSVVAPTLATAHPPTAVTPARLMTAPTTASATSSPFLTPLTQQSLAGTHAAVNALSLDQLLSSGRYPSVLAGNSVAHIPMQGTHSYIQSSASTTPTNANSIPLTQYLPGQYFVAQNPNSGILSTLLPTYGIPNSTYVTVQPHPQNAHLLAHSQIGIPQSANSIPFITTNQPFSSSSIAHLPFTYSTLPQQQRAPSSESGPLAQPLSASTKSSTKIEPGVSPIPEDSSDFKGSLPVSATTSESGAIVLQTTVPADLKKPHTLTLYLGKSNEVVPCYEAKLLDTRSEPVISRVKRACNHCKQAKTKCDKQRPCRRCRHTGRSAQCTDSVHKKRGRKRPDAFLEELQKLEKYQENDNLLLSSVK